MDDNESRVIKIAISHRRCKGEDRKCDPDHFHQVGRVIEKHLKPVHQVEIEYHDWEYYPLFDQRKEEFKKFVLEEADIAVVLIEDEFGKEQETGYKRIIKRYNKNKKVTDPGKKLHAPKLRPFVFVRNNNEADNKLLEKIEAFGPQVMKYADSDGLRGKLEDALDYDIKELLKEQQPRPSAPEVPKTVTEAAGKPQPLPQPDGVSKGAEPNPLPDQPGTGASAQGEGHKKPGRWKVVAGIVAAAEILALLFVLLAPYYRPFVNSLWNGSTPNTDSLQTGACAIVPVDTGKTPAPTDEPKKQDPLPKYIENGCTVKSKDGDISLVNALKGEILNCEALNLAFPEKGRTAWKIEIWEAKKQLDSTASGNNIAHFQYSASIHYKGNQVAGAESDWDNSYSRSRLSGDNALAEAREKARAEIINTIIEKLKR